MSESKFQQSCFRGGVGSDLGQEEELVTELVPGRIPLFLQHASPHGCAERGGPSLGAEWD